MHQTRLIPEATLAALWRVHLVTLQEWRRRDGLIVSDEQLPSSRGKMQHYYSPATVDAFHQARTVGFDGYSLPSTTLLLSGNPGLYTIEDAVGIFGKSKHVVWRWVRLGRIPAIQITPKAIRFPAALLRILADDADGAVDQDIAAKVLCVSTHTVANLITERVLERVVRREHVGRNFVTRDSLLSLLQQTIVGDITPEEWWLRCVNDTEPPTTISAAAHALHTHPDRLFSFLVEHKLPYLFTIGGHTKLPAWLMAEAAAARQTLSPAQLGAIFGVDASVAESWLHAQRFCRHPRSTWPKCPTMRCVRDYLHTHRTNVGVTFDAWLASTTVDGMVPLSANALLETTPGATWQDIEAAACSGNSALRGVRLPDMPGQTPGLVLARSDALVWRRRWLQSLASDYHLPIDDPRTYNRQP